MCCTRAQLDQTDASAKIKFRDGKTAWFPVGALSAIPFDTGRNKENAFDRTHDQLPDHCWSEYYQKFQVNFI